MSPSIAPRRLLHAFALWLDEGRRLHCDIAANPTSLDSWTWRIRARVLDHLVRRYGRDVPPEALIDELDHDEPAPPRRSTPIIAPPEPRIVSTSEAKRLATVRHQQATMLRSISSSALPAREQNLGVGSKAIRNRHKPAITSIGACVVLIAFGAVCCATPSWLGLLVQAAALRGNPLNSSEVMGMAVLDGFALLVGFLFGSMGVVGLISYGRRPPARRGRRSRPAAQRRT